MRWFSWVLVLFMVSVGGVQAGQGRDKQRGEAGEFDYYLLALSWSPTFCLTHTGNEQCTGKGYGFVLHGLWPQYARGGWPQSCAPLTPLSAEQRQQGLTLFPTARLMEHEWKKHGTCSGLGATAYLDTTDRALGKVRIPEALQPSTAVREYSAEEIAVLFQQSNPGMPSDGVAVSCSGPQLSEVKVCLSRDLGYASCGKGVKSQCRAGKVRLPPVR
ncbi:ribonuclease [Pseudomonas gingeri NCPPB 3146 = LMG 5327]|uniref:Ribonuclease T2 n=2 Tax=Pseudomonas gingeri TaxID=117681 RepID=A0A7Y7XXD6_9PSED|nr:MULTISPECIES: ribonuclease T2 [Pseudomonas]NVZ66676.1 ribonuclease T2 [Pseudomonas gingeri]NVZ74765.1 ribonuclease T2 [Pseudomonas gingeri]NWC12847.1 ribonuclease T2 [Pseudomonas gingeri]NWE72190.1 ribonuclease T2 [Pseudomonas gingeri]PNQ91354.1 ribonuclease [Pseudomonas gingeri NCPPB 3146 = LMG 5327]